MHEVKPKKHIIGIELGTNSTRVARFNDAGRAEIINNSYGSPITPSVIHFETSGEVIVGDEAKKFLGIGIPNVFAEFKREMGTDKSWHLGNQLITPTELTAILLKKVVADYTEQYGEPDTIVITWPANFRNEQREATREAAARAGLKVEYFIEEPTAAALYYATDKPLSGKYLVYDFGGGTFDVTLIEAQGNDITVLYQDGVQQLGGKDLDAALLKIIGDKFRSKTGDEFDAIDCLFSKLDIESAKHTLSTRDKTQIRLVSAKHSLIIIDITRNEFEAGISHLVSQAEMACENVLRCGKDDPSEHVKKNDIKEIFMCGDTSRVPAMQASVERLFGKKPVVKNPDQAVALGAAIYAAVKTPEIKYVPNISIVPTAPHYLGSSVITNHGEVINDIVISKGTMLPCSTERIYCLANDNQNNITIDMTQSAIEEHNSEYVSKIYAVSLTLPQGLRAGQPIKVIFGYDINGCAYMRSDEPNGGDDLLGIGAKLIPPGPKPLSY
jgi:molecular chaperone DnaK